MGVCGLLIIPLSSFTTLDFGLPIVSECWKFQTFQKLLITICSDALFGARMNSMHQRLNVSYLYERSTLVVCMELTKYSYGEHQKEQLISHQYKYGTPKYLTKCTTRCEIMAIGCYEGISGRYDTSI